MRRSSLLPSRVPVILLGAAACASGAPRSAPAPMSSPASLARVDTVRVVDTVVLAPPVSDTALRAGRFDNGRMWTFEHPPLDYFREAYGFAPDSTWFQRARLGALRLPNCSASFVSATGLVLTNHHCAREHVVAVSRPGETLLDTGFYAATHEAERPIAGLYLDQLIAIEDVTAEMDAADDREVAAEAIAERVAERYGGDSAGVAVETVELWNGARTSAYVFHRFDDVRLVMAPELQAAFFGGDPDNFTYPRYDLDMSFLRVYVDGAPYRPEVYFRWGATGVATGDPVFVVGNPGSTSRLHTVAQLEYRREVGDKALLDFFVSRIAALESFARAAPAAAESVDVRNKVLELSNSRKAYAGIWRGLHDPVILARRRDAERRFQDALAADPSLRERFGGLIDRLAGLQQRRRRFDAQVGAFTALGAPDWTSSVLLRGVFAFQYVNARRGGAGADVLAQVRSQLEAVPHQSPALQEALLAARLADLARHLGDDDQAVRGILAGATPAARARGIVSQSVLTDSATAVAALEAGSLVETDPAIRLAAGLLPSFATFQNQIGPIQEEEAQLGLELGRAHFALYGTANPPDATFSLRIADGVVRGYPYNGTEAPSHTTFHGMLDRYHSFGEGTAWDLPPRWRRLPAAFDRGTPFNFVMTADIIGGNSGSPVLNRNLELVGLVFDGNIESLPGDYIFLPELNRAVAVDARGILEVLEDLYGARRLVAELRAPAQPR